MAGKSNYRVSRFSATGRWFPLMGSQGQKGYAQGWFDAVSSYRPCPKYRLEKFDLPSKEWVVVEERDANGPPTVNVGHPNNPKDDPTRAHEPSSAEDLTD